MTDIFVSYSRQDETFARALAAGLSARGWSVWWDRDIPAGRTFDEVIAEALAGARCVIVVWSKASVASDWVREEAEEGRRREILIPVLIDDVRPPLGFGRIQAADLRGWSGGASEGFDRLVADIAALLDPSPQDVSAPPSLPAPPAASAAAAPPADTFVTAVTTPPAAEVREESATPDARRRRFDIQTRWKWIAAAVVVAAVLVFTTYRFGGIRQGSQPRPIMAAASEPALRLNAVLADGTEPIASGVAYQVFKDDRDAEGNRTRVAGSASYDGPPKFALTPGRYFVTALYGSASASTEVDVEEATLTLQTLNLRAGVVRPSASLMESGTPLATGVAYAVHDSAADVEGNRKQITSSPNYDGPPRFVVPAGRYLVTATYGSASRSIELDVAAGENKALPVPLQAGILNLSSRLAAAAPPLAKGVSYDVYDAAADAEGNRRRITSSPNYDGPPRLPLPAGRYFVTARYGSATASTEIDLGAGQVMPLVLDLRAGVLAPQAIAPGGSDPLKNGVSYHVYQAERDAEGNRPSVVGSASYDGPPRLPLPAGRYYVTASGAQGKADAEVTLGAGEHRELRLQLRP